MSENTQRPPAEVTPPTPSVSSAPPSIGRSAGPEAKTETQPSNHGADDGNKDPRAALLRDIEKTRIPVDLKEQILADLPPPEERERLLRELQENGGLSFEEFFESLLSEFEQ
jgi:hypothetical protein